MDIRTAAALTDKLLVECREFLRTLDPEDKCATKNAEAHKSLHHARLLMSLFFRHKMAQAAQTARPQIKIDGAVGLPAVLRNQVK